MTAAIEPGDASATDALRAALEDARDRLGAVLAANPDWAALRDAGASGGLDAPERERLRARLRVDDTWVAYDRIEQALGLLAAAGPTARGDRALSARIPTLLSAPDPSRQRRERTQSADTTAGIARAPSAPMPIPSALSSVAPPAVSLDDILGYIRRGAASQQPRPLARMLSEPATPPAMQETGPHLLLPRSAPSPEPPADTRIVQRLVADLVGAPARLNSPEPQPAPPPPVVARDPRAPAATEPRPPMPASWLHQQADARLAVMEAEIEILAAPPPPRQPARTSSTLPMESAADLRREARPPADIDLPGVAVDEAEVQIVVAAAARERPLEPLPELPLQPRTGRPRKSEVQIADAVATGHAATEEASVVIVSRPDGAAPADLPFYADARVNPPDGSVRRFMRALSGGR